MERYLVNFCFTKADGEDGYGHALFVSEEIDTLFQVTEMKRKIMKDNDLLSMGIMNIQRFPI